MSHDIDYIQDEFTKIWHPRYNYNLRSGASFALRVSVHDFCGFLRASGGKVYANRLEKIAIQNKITYLDEVAYYNE